jgi:hypothetical protein
VTIVRNPVRHSIEFVKSGRGKAKNPPAPHFPKGRVLRVARNDEPHCTVNLPYPAPECGHFIVRYKDCGLSVVATAVGRPDDPIWITLPCDLPTKAKCVDMIPIAAIPDGRRRRWLWVCVPGARRAKGLPSKRSRPMTNSAVPSGRPLPSASRRSPKTAKLTRTKTEGNRYHVGALTLRHPSKVHLLLVPLVSISYAFSMWKAGSNPSPSAIYPSKVVQQGPNAGRRGWEQALPALGHVQRSPEIECSQGTIQAQAK